MHIPKEAYSVAYLIFFYTRCHKYVDLDSIRVFPSEYSNLLQDWNNEFFFIVNK